MKTKAAILYETDKPLLIKEIETPLLQKGQVLVKVLYAGVCGSQMNEIRGRKGVDRYLPHLLGHEGSGSVEETGPEVTRVKKGDFVVLSWIKGKGVEAPSSEYRCGLEKINSGAITTWSQYAVISENRLFKIPKEVTPDVAALLGCAVPTGAGIVKNELKMKGGASLAIFGIGGIGSSALLYAASLKGSQLIAVDLNDFKLKFARGLGATALINPMREDTRLRIKELTGGKGVDYAIEASGSKRGMEEAFEVLSDSGLAVLAGNLRKGEKIGLDPFDLIKGKRIIGTWGGKTDPDREIPFYAGEYLEGRLKLDKLISKVYPLHAVNQATRDLEEGKIIRGLISCQI